MESADLARWDHRGDALARAAVLGGLGTDLGAGGAASGSGSYVLYYAVRYEGAGRQCISVATAADPAGPFVDRSAEPLIFQDDRGGSIDPSPFVDADGTAYLLWKSDDNALGRTPSLWGAPLEPDGLALAGPPVELLRQADAPWEKPLVEAPSLARLGDDSYVPVLQRRLVGVGRVRRSATPPARRPLGPFRKETETGPWLASEPGMAGPGGAEVFPDADGGWRIAFHAWTPPRVGYDDGGARSLWIERLEFRDGGPVLP